MNADLPQDALRILCALISTGHYSEIPDDPDAFRVLRSDNGQDFDHSVFSRRYTCIAVEEAIALAEELRDELQLKKDAECNPR